RDYLTLAPSARHRPGAGRERAGGRRRPVRADGYTQSADPPPRVMSTAAERLSSPQPAGSPAGPPARVAVPVPPGPPASPGAADDGGSYKWRVLAVVGAGVFMVTLDSGIVNVALPVLTQEFNAPLVLAQWVVLGYVLCITGLLLPAGRLADMLGRREVFLVGFLLFGAASALCGLAPTIYWLI